MHMEALRHAALGWLGSGSTVRFMLDSQFRILWANDAGQAAIESRGWIESKDGILTLAHNPGAGALASEAARLGEEEIFVQSYAMPSDGGHVVAVMRQLPSGQPQQRVYGLELRRRADADAVRYAGYRSYFGISQAEDRVLQQLLKGHNVEKCAATLDLSMDTVRSHVRQLYTKMNVSSREALFHVIMPFRVP
ncbi:MAG TPA: helix-turn-helix transcriptional regulator [Sphingobium sp.]|nr:helix-turn-helix transcriptional regulator [Sphingobium sp.]